MNDVHFQNRRVVDCIVANRFKVKPNYLSQINELKYIFAELLDHPIYTTRIISKLERVENIHIIQG